MYIRVPWKVGEDSTRSARSIDLSAHQRISAQRSSPAARVHNNWWIRNTVYALSGTTTKPNRKIVPVTEREASGLLLSSQGERTLTGN